MLRRQERKPKRANSPTPADAIDFAILAQGLNAAPAPATAAMSDPPAGFDFSTIPIIPPARRAGREGGVLSPDTSERIQSQRGGGAPLEPTVQRRMEETLGHPFADVRVHTDGESETLNHSLGAHAFTLGSDIFLGQHATSNGTYGGDQLLAHELTHVVQQRGTAERGPLTVGATDGAGEREADGVAGAVASGAMTVPGAMVGDAGGARIQRQPDTAPQQGGKGTKAPGKSPPDLATLAAQMTAMQEQMGAMQVQQAQVQAVAQNQRSALALDLRWRGMFGARMANYKQAIWRVTGAIDMADKGFQDAQIAQSQTDQLTTQLLGLGASVLFAGVFEWVAGAGLKGLGTASSKIGDRVRKADVAATEAALPIGAAAVSLPGRSAAKWSMFGENPTSILETVENPANALFGGYMTNIRGSQGQQQGSAKIASAVGPAEKATEQGQPGGGPGGGAVAYLARKSEALEQQSQFIEQAFVDRSLALGGLSDEQWASFDVGAQEQIYQQLLDGLDAAGSGVEKMKPVEDVANVIERYMWASWVLNSADRESSGRLWNFGTDIDLRLIKIGVERDAGVLLSEHWWQHSSDNWGYAISAWARGYKGSIVLNEK